MISAISIAASGLAAAGLRLGVSAANVANALDTGPLPGTATAYPPAYVPQQVDQVDTAGGGTTATTQPVSPSYVPSFDPNAPYANQNGLVAAPNVDLANEVVQQILASITYTANAKVMKVAAQMTGTLLDVTA
jgi:flagellar basal-body rod protein FlgC